MIWWKLSIEFRILEGQDLPDALGPQGPDQEAATETVTPVGDQIQEIDVKMTLSKSFFPSYQVYLVFFSFLYLQCSVQVSVLRELLEFYLYRRLIVKITTLRIH